MKLYELAKQLGVSSTELAEKCRAVGFKVKGHMSSVDDRQARMISAMFPASRAKKAAPPKRKAKPAPKRKKKKAKPKPKPAAVEERAPAPAPEEGRPAPLEPAPSAAAAESAPVEEPKPVPAAAEERPAAEEKEPEEFRPGELVRPAPKETVIEFKHVGSIPASISIQHAEVETDKSPEAPRRPEAPKSQVESVKVDSRWDKLQPVERIRSMSRQTYARRPTRRTRRTQRRKARVKPSNVPSAVEEGGALALQAPATGRAICEALGLRSAFLLPKLRKHGIDSINDIVPDEVVQLVGADYGIEITVKKELTAEEGLTEVRARARAEGAHPRAPVVTFMGHVDHGKTSLLDAIRQTNVVAAEPGAITQRTGAYTVPYEDSFITFIDTPGHEAFTEMRARGANVTDIVVLVIAADDGVMPQTEEAISHARAAGAPMVVALNKMDLATATPIKAKQQLAAIGLQPEEWGGQLGVVEVSATTKDGIDALLERIWLEAELIELRSEPGNPAWGGVLDSELTEGRGVSATILVRDGTMRQGDVVICGTAWGRVRMMYDDKGVQIKEAGPSVPVWLGGLDKAPEPGEKAYVIRDLDEARSISEERNELQKKAVSLPPAKLAGLEELARLVGEGEGEGELKIILKADTRGTLEAVRKQVDSIGTEEVTLEVLHAGVGAGTVADVNLAKASNAMIVGFGVELDERARAVAEGAGVVVRLHEVIYELVDELTAALERRLAPEEREVVSAHLEVRKVFAMSRAGNVAGCYVRDGVANRSDRIRVVRDGEVVHTGAIASLRREKDDVREVRAGFECGLKIGGLEDVREGDILEAFRIEEFARKLPR